MNIVKNLVDESKYGIKCPYEMEATRIVVHETANDASAKNEIAYMIRNDKETSFLKELHTGGFSGGSRLRNTCCNPGDTSLTPVLGISHMLWGTP